MNRIGDIHDKVSEGQAAGIYDIAGPLARVGGRMGDGAQGSMWF